MFSYSIKEKSFWIRQYSHLKEDGFSALLRKLITLTRPIIIFLLSLICIPLVIIIRLIKPIYWIRFGWFFSSRIGHFAFDVEYYLSERELRLHPEKANDIFFYRWGKPANIYFSKLVKEHLNIGSWVEPLFIANNFIYRGSTHKVLPAVINSGSRDIKGILTQVKPQLYFSDEETVLGHSFLRSFDIYSEKFICMIVRDSAYLKDATYHNYRDSDVKTFMNAAIALADKGYAIFRMGKKVKNPIDVSHPNIIDYAATDLRSDFLDIWLMANCSFCISTGTGLDEISRIFRKPAVYLNIVPFTNMVSYDNVISVPSILKWKENGEMLTLTQCLNHDYYFVDEYFNAGIEIEKLKPSDICNTVLEKEARLNGTWQESNEDKLLQEEFWKIFKSHQNFQKYHGNIHPEARVGAHFLSNNPEWLN